MKTLTRSRRERIAIFYALLAFAAFVAGVAGAAMAEPGSNPWIFPIAGLAGYVACASRALRIWQGRGAASLGRGAALRHRLERHVVAGFALLLLAVSVYPEPGAFERNGSPGREPRLINMHQSASLLHCDSSTAQERS
jgi:hypothetical protein